MGELAGAHYLVPGGAGFIGSNLVSWLYEQGAEVTVVDNFSSGKRDNLAEFLSSPRFHLVEHDVIDPLDSSQIGSIDGILNLACPASPPYYQLDPIQTFRTSVWGNWNLAMLALEQDVPMLYTSTSEVYGDPLVHPQSESYWGNVNPIGIRSCYDEGKRSGETMLCDLARQRGLKVRIARIFNTYGPGMDVHDGRVVSNFVVQGLRNEALTIYGDGSQTRSFCYVGDMVRGLWQLFQSDERFNAKPVNLGNDGEFTILELVRSIEAALGEPFQVEHHPLPSDDPKKRKPDLTVARRELGWEPTVSLQDGLKPTVDHFRRALSEITGF